MDVLIFFKKRNEGKGIAMYTVKYRALKLQRFFLIKSKCPFNSRIVEEKWICNYVHNQRGTFLVLNLTYVKYVGF